MSHVSRACWAWTTACLLAALAAPSCSGSAHRGGGQAAAEALGPGALLPPDTLGFDFAWHQLVTVHWSDPDGGARSESFEAVVQGRAGVLQVVGLGPMSRVAFVISQAPDGITYENRSGRELPFEPAYMIADVQRVSFPWGEAPEPGFSGQRRLDVLDVVVAESWLDGRLVERRFARVDAPERGQVVVSYTDWTDDGVARTAVLESGWHGYRLTVETVSTQRL